MVHHLGLRSAFDASVASIHGVLRIPLHLGDLAVTHVNQHAALHVTSLTDTSYLFIHRFTPFMYQVAVTIFILCSIFYFALSGVFQPGENSPLTGDKELGRKYRKG